MGWNGSRNVEKTRESQERALASDRTHFETDPRHTTLCGAKSWRTSDKKHIVTCRRCLNKLGITYLK